MGDGYRLDFDVGLEGPRADGDAGACRRQVAKAVAVDAVDLVYSEFKNAATQRFIAEQFLPVVKTAKVTGQKNADFIFEPSKEVLIAELMPKILNTQLYKAVLDANASEHGARMTAMDKASDNANELLKALKIS